ncbi:MAG: S-layer protein domain-containing protein [Candidatus Methanoperedens sp.]|nr:S-layer protein domain-containing protein [Candidatus Methanoperedens sp.]
MKKLTIVALVAMLLLTVALPANAAIKATSVEIRGSVAGNGTTSWTNSTFAGFFYDIDDNLGTETLTITTSGGDNRTIAENALSYTTTGQPKLLKAVEQKYNSSGDLAAADGLEHFEAGKMAMPSGYYTIIGWQAEKYVAIKMRANKLSKLLVEHGTSSAEKKTMTVGETWEIGGGYTLTANSIDAKASPRQVWLTLSKDGVKKDDKVVTSGSGSDPIYTYSEKSLCGETDVPILVTYVDSVFAGATTDMVQFRYTWLISPTCTEVKSSDVYGSLKVVQTSPTLTLNNSETTMTLSQDSSVDVMGDIKLKVADNTTLRYYPYVLKTKPGTYEVRGSIAGNGTNSWTPASFAGFFYDIDDNLGTETLTITTSGGDNRTIAENALSYTTRGQSKLLKAVEQKYNSSGDLAAADGLEHFEAGKMATPSGYYTIIGWQAEKYVAIKMRANKLSKLLVEHGTSSAEKKTMTVGETWEIGGGYTLTANSIDAKASPRQVWLTLSKDGVKKDDKVVTSGSGSDPIYTYSEKSLCGETDVPILVTYVDSVFAGATTDMVQFRYTWLISPTCTEVKSSDVYGSLKVVQTSPTLTLNNSETTMTLSQDTSVDVMGGIRLKVADNTTLRYYPFVEYVIEGGTTGATPGTTPGVTAGVTPGKTPATNVTVTTPPVTTTTAVAGQTTKPAAAATTKKTEPGFEAVFAIAGLLAVAFLVLRQRK